MFQRILIAWDGSEVALRAFDIAVDISRRYGAELIALSVAYSPAHAETTADATEAVSAARRYLAESFAAIIDRAHRAGVQVDHRIVEGAIPAQAVLDYAHEHGFDLIVCGHHHAARTGRLLLKGVGLGLLEGPTPVLIVGEATT